MYNTLAPVFVCCLMNVESRRGRGGGVLSLRFRGGQNFNVYDTRAPVFVCCHMNVESRRGRGGGV